VLAQQEEQQREFASVSKKTLHDDDRQAKLSKLEARLIEQSRKNAFLRIRADAERVCHLSIRAWHAAVSAARQAEAFHQEIASMQVYFQAETRFLQEEAKQHAATNLLWRCSAWSRRTVEAAECADLMRAFCNWSALVRDSQHQKTYRRQCIAAAADASSENYRLRTQSSKDAKELRKQRRAHGVAAIHASLDRQVQVFLHAWFRLSRDAQQESKHQLQLDACAAESAANCICLRMEYRRGTSALRAQNRALGLRAVIDGMQHVLHIVLYAWRCLVARRSPTATSEEETTIGPGLDSEPKELKGAELSIESLLAEREETETQMKQEIDALRSRIDAMEQKAKFKHAELLQAQQLEAIRAESLQRHAISSGLEPQVQQESTGS
jgi:hypothetical protein